MENPNGISFRLRRLESDMTEAYVRLRALDRLEERLLGLTDQMKGLRTEHEVKRDQEAADRRQDRRALWAATAVIVAAVIGAATVVLSSGP